MTLELVALAAAAVGYLVACALFPFRACGRCSGSGKRLGLGGVRRCPTCRGTGLRLRLGRRVWNYLRHQHDEGIR